ncbi:carbohydrate binding [Branchiostoma belcheri]|nr:carbohydrate binding [Branchiostoma belcheri]
MSASLRLFCTLVLILFTIGHGHGQGNHAFDVLRTANQTYEGVDFFAIEARLPADGLSASLDWCKDYQNLCGHYGLRPTGCGEIWAVPDRSASDPNAIRCVTEYNSDPYINHVLSCHPARRVATVANLAFSARAKADQSFGFNNCHATNCQRGIRDSHSSLYNTKTAFALDGSGDRIVYTVCAGSAATQCPTLTAPDNGTLSPGGANSYNDVVTFTCNRGYELEGNSSVRCQADRTWSGPVPTCARSGSVEYQSLGCWRDTWTGAIPSLEGTDVRLDGDPLTRNDPIEKCYQVALSRGFAVFAVQAGGECFGSADAQNTYKKYGPSTACAAGGEGGNIDECATDNGGCAQTCTNVQGSYNCSCLQGFVLKANEHGCEDTDECATDNGGCAQTCTNVPGSYTCSCPQGFVLIGDSHGCEDLDECATENGRCDQICTNVPGSYSCFCRQGFVLIEDAHGCGVCGHCLGGDVNCDPVSGVCSAGCRDGWKTQLCDKAVDPPMDLAVTDITDEGFKVTWSPSPDPDLQGYRVVVSNLDKTTAVNQSTDEAWFPVVGLLPETTYIIRVTALFSSGGWRSQSEAAVIPATTAAIPTTIAQTTIPAATTQKTSRVTTRLSTKPATSTVQHAYEAGWDEESSDDATTPSAAETTKQTSGMPTSMSTRPSTPTAQLGSNTDGITETISRPPGGNRATPADQALGNSLESMYAESVTSSPQDVLQILAKAADVSGDDVVLGQPTSAAEEKAQMCRKAIKTLASEMGRAQTPQRLQRMSELSSLVIKSCPGIPQEDKDMAMGVLKFITSKLDQLDMSDPSTVQSVGGSLVESVGSLLEDPERDKEEADVKLTSDLEEDQSLSPKERRQKVEEKKQENQAKRRRFVQEGRQILDGLLNAIISATRPGAPAVTIERGGITLRAQRIWGNQFGGQVVQTEDGSFQLPSKTALFADYTPHNVAMKFTQFQQNPFTWGRGEYQPRSSVMELSLQQNNFPVAFNNLTEDFNITIPAKSGNKPATTTVTIPAQGNGSSSYHLLNLTNAAEGFLVTITPLNTSVVYRVSGRYGGRPGDQNYNMSTETYILPEECALMKTLSGEEDTEKSEARMFISGEDGPVDYYIKVEILGPVTECGSEKRTDEKEPHAADSYAYQMEWARLGCVFWSETQEAWRTDGCSISHQSTITSTICHCNHLTAFGSDFATPPNTILFEALNFRDLTDNGAVVTTILVTFCLYSLTSVAIKISERRGKGVLNGAIRLDNLQDNFRYRLLIWTGAAKHAGTESTVAFKLFGDAANSDVRLVDITEKVFTRTSQVTLTFSTAEQLGKVELLQLMHDNSGEGSRASWHVDRAAVQDLTTGKLFYFFCDEWLAADRGDGQVVKTLPVASEEDLRSFGFLFPASLHHNLAEEHLLLSVAFRPEGSTFTRIERLGCCLSFFAASMVSSAMWLRDEVETEIVQGFSLGPFSFTLNGVYTGFMASITCLPVVTAIVLLFQYSRPSSKGDRRVRDVETGGQPTQRGPAKRLPHGCKYVAWMLVMLSFLGSAVFTTLFSMQWGRDKTNKWLSAFLITFLADVFLMQPGKSQHVGQQQRFSGSLSVLGCSLDAVTGVADALQFFPNCSTPNTLTTKSFILQIFLLAIFTSSLRKTRAVKKIFEEKRDRVWMEANAVSGFNCDAFRTRRKMERLSMTSLINIKQAKKKQRRDRRNGEILRDIMVSCFYVLLVLSITNEHHSTTQAFYQTQSATNTFVQSLDEVNDADTFWSWLNGTALENFYPETSYNDNNLRWQEKGFTADMQSVLVAPPSMIQARVKPGLCTVPAAMQESFDECSSGYNEHTKETGAFRKGWERVMNTSAMESEAPGWTYLPSGYTSLPIHGVTTQYWGDGFGLNLGKSADEMRSILAELKANRWIDKRTRAIFLEALLYNGNLDLFTSVTMVFEFSETAGVFTHHRVQAFRLHQRPGTIGYIYVLLEITYVIVLLYTLWKEMKTARAAGWAYMMEPWKVVEIFNFFLAFTVIALYGFKRTYSSMALAAINAGKDEVHHFRSAVSVSLVYGWFLAFLTFVNMLKFLRLLRFNPFLAKLMSMIRGMSVEFSSFTIYLFICMSAFGVFAHLKFGLTVAEYRAAGGIPILGPIYFITFICIIFLVLMNIAMAIIDSSLPDMRNHIMSEEDQYFIQGLWERFTAFFGFWKVPVAENNSLDTLHDSLVEVEIKVEKLWLQRQFLFNLEIKDADLPAEPEFVPTVKDVPDATAVELHVPKGGCRIIAVRPASPNSRTVDSSQAICSDSKVPVVVASRSPSKEDTQESQYHYYKECEVGRLSVNLSAGDKAVLTSNEMLTDDHIQAAQKLLHHQYPALQGLEAPTVGLCEDGFAKMTGKGLQIHHNSRSHWVLSSYTDGQVRLYDSIGTDMTASLQVQLYQTYSAFADQESNVLTIILPEVQRQNNFFDCGLFAIAWAVDIAQGQDVSSIAYDDRKMRSHLKKCFEQGRLTPFPHLTGHRKKVGLTRVSRVSLVCRCKQEEGLGRIETCRSCQRIFHVSCLPVIPPSDDTWKCGDCAV